MNALVQGGLAGFVATAPMTAVMEAWHRQLPWFERYPLPPRQITLDIARKAGLARHLDDRARTVATAASHFGYGTGAGALYGLACQRLMHVGIPSGVLYGLVVWTGSYLGLLPALGILEPAMQHPRRRNVLMIVAHMVWGATLGGVLQWIETLSGATTMKRTYANCAMSLASLAAAGLVYRALARRRTCSFRGKTVVITGGSRGLGLELARLWAAEGAKVAICARTPADVRTAVESLRRQGARVIGDTCDVRDQIQVERFLQSVVEQLGEVDVLVNNAGIIQTGPLECMTVDDYRTAMETHFWGPLYTTLAVLPDMRRRQQGRIVNISSIGGKVSVPHLSPYSASKFALVGLSAGMQAELEQHGIYVTTVCPGLMRTGSPRNARFKGRHRAEYAWFSISDSLPVISMNSARAARRIIEACRRGDAETVLSVPAQAAARLHGAFPGMTAAVLGFVNRWLPGPGGIGSESLRGDKSFSKWSPSALTALTERAAIANHEIR